MFICNNDKGVKIRLDIHYILYSIYKFNKNLNNNSIKEKIRIIQNKTLHFK